MPSAICRKGCRVRLLRRIAKVASFVGLVNVPDPPEVGFTSIVYVAEPFPGNQEPTRRNLYWFYRVDRCADIKEHVIKPVVGDLVDANTRYYINATGKFVLGGPPADAGLTGRKIIVDTYGGHGAHGGGAFSGKCVTKVDRSGAYMARYVAKNIVGAGLADRCEIQVAYAIGVAEPVSVMVDLMDTGAIPKTRVEEIVTEVFDLRPAAIIEHLDLLRPIYRKTAAYGHFGRSEPEFSWENMDMAEVLKEKAGL